MSSEAVGAAADAAAGDPVGTRIDASAGGPVDGPAAGDPVGTIYDIQGFSVQDGPGIRTTVFLKGCPLRCPWCHSPESQRFDIQLSWQWRKCIGIEQCGLCLECCPRGAIALGGISPESGGAPSADAAVDVTSTSSEAGGTSAGASSGDGLWLIEVDWDKCDDCGVCAERCPAGALSMWGRRYTVSEVVARVLRDRPFFEKSGGGVTISGGEPLSQPEFTLALLAALKQQGIHVALDTTGFTPWKVIEKALPLVDLFLLDLKKIDSQAHKSVVGVSSECILESARGIAAAGGKVQIRIPVIPRFNDSGEDFRAFAEFLQELGDAVTIVQLLPYHAMGVPKWERIKHGGPILEATAPSDKRMGELKAILEEHGSTVQVH